MSFATTACRWLFRDSHPPKFAARSDFTLNSKMLCFRDDATFIGRSRSESRLRVCPLMLTLLRLPEFLRTPPIFGKTRNQFPDTGKRIINFVLADDARDELALDLENPF